MERQKLDSNVRPLCLRTDLHNPAWQIPDQKEVPNQALQGPMYGVEGV